MSDKPRRLGRKVKLFVLLLAVAAVIVLARTLPLEEGAAALRRWVEGLGAWGPVAFGAIYAAATVAFVPAALLTLAAGAIFGLGAGFATVSLASTAGAGLAFLIGRHLARKRVERMAASNRSFGAIDGAIAEGGWRIVALLRLSPAVPFNLQNYLFGLTRIGFWPYLLTSWIAMMPGTFLYVYVGHLTGAALGGERARTPAEWALLAVGLAATLAVTLYVTVLARRQLRQRSALDLTNVEPLVPARAAISRER